MQICLHYVFQKRQKPRKTDEHILRLVFPARSAYVSKERGCILHCQIVKTVMFMYEVYSCS